MLYNLTIFYPRLQTLDPKPPGAAAAAAPSTEAESPTASTSSPGSPNSTTSNGSNSNKPSSALGRGIRSVLSRSTGSASKSRPSSPKSLLTPRGLDYLTSVLVRLVLLLSHASNAPLSGSPLGSAVLCLGELPAAPAWFADTPPVPAYAAVDQSKLPSTSTTPESDVLGSLPPLAAKLLHVLDATTRHCFPGTVEPDEAKNRARLEREGRDVVDLDAELAPLLLIMRKCVIGDERGSVGATLRGRLLSNRMWVPSLPCPIARREFIRRASVLTEPCPIAQRPVGQIGQAQRLDGPPSASHELGLLQQHQSGVRRALVCSLWARL